MQVLNNSNSSTLARRVWQDTSCRLLVCKATRSVRLDYLETQIKLGDTQKLQYTNDDGARHYDRAVSVVLMGYQYFVALCSFILI